MLELIQKRGLMITLAVSAVIIGIFFLTLNEDLILNGAYFLLIIALILAIALPVVTAIKNPKSLMKAGIGLGAILLFYLIGSAMANDLVLASGTTEVKFVEANGAKFSGAILNATYILLVVAVLSVFASPIIKKLNK